MRVIFLDVDGVLNYHEQLVRDQRPDSIDQRCVKRLRRLVDSAEDVRLVLSSTWRRDPRDGRFSTKLRASLAEEGLDLFSQTVVCFGGGRGREIKLWLEEFHGQVDGFLILDDDTFDMGDDLKPYIVKTSFAVKGGDGGLQEEHMEKAIAILQGENRLRLQV